MSDCPNKERNLKNCNCSYPGCSKKGICCECIRSHLLRREVPACFFDKKAEATYDRSIDYFISTYKNG
ncbi:MAG: hypothetical protein JW734_02960 [Candidatus Omnitrophica bacterium]|nr:hypothetical protein [Candidatus Omnitrophota bacterium]